MILCKHAVRGRLLWSTTVYWMSAKANLALDGFEYFMRMTFRRQNVAQNSPEQIGCCARYAENTGMSLGTEK
jgi:hypothetical protein